MSFRYNVCTDSYEETLERMKAIQADFFLPNLTTPPQDFERMSKIMIDGLWCFDPFDPYVATIFFIKRAIGVPNYQYFGSELPPNYDRNLLEYRSYSYIDRMFIWLSVITRQFLLRIFIIRWFFNIATYINEFFIRYFPILAIIKFGFSKAFVELNI